MNEQDLPINVQGAEKMARFWLYQQPRTQIPDAEARTIAKALVDLLRIATSNQETRQP